ncbi:hypothetical protein VKT23_019197 [Stygiomarasmius scandens]|uniref:Uncharacterized protein n=1 Tax=Marasmiellus scandens TaxID=2682957 RepID=A0ABR1IQ24_9AGAR
MSQAGSDVPSFPPSSRSSTPGPTTPQPPYRPAAYQFPRGADPLLTLLGPRPNAPRSSPPPSPPPPPPPPPAGSSGQGQSTNDDITSASKADIDRLGNTLQTSIQGLNSEMGNGFREVVEGIRQLGRFVRPEDPAPHTSNTTDPTHPKPPKKKSEPKRRSSSVNSLRKDIRTHLKELLGDREQDLDPGPEEANAWVEMSSGNLENECCNKDRFRIYLGGVPSHPWNKSAARVFADILIEDEETSYSAEDRQVLERAFMVRITSLVKQYREARDRQAESPEEKRRKKRKADLFTRRLNIVKTVEELNRHRDIIERLGIDGMSEDEEVARLPYIREYHVRYPRWRSHQLGRFLHTLDLVYDLKKQDLGHPRGNQPHLRKRPQNLADPRNYLEGNFVPDLPRDAYEERWLESKSEREKCHRVRPREEQYHFIHDPEVYAWLDR